MISIITPLDNTIKSVMEFTWPMIFMCLIIAVSIRLTDIIKNKKELILYKDLSLLFFMLYIICLFQVVSFEDQNTINSLNNLTPFKEILRYHLGSNLFLKNVIGNMIMFIPYGFFVTFLTKINRKREALILVLTASLSIELTQIIIGRVFDVDDIILNVIGGMIGYFLYRLLDKIGDSLPKVFKSNIFLNILAVILVTLIITYIYVVVR